MMQSTLAPSEFLNERLPAKLEEEIGSESESRPLTSDQLARAGNVATKLINLGGESGQCD